MRLGMNQDIDPKYQPDGTYRYALNAVLETTEGELGSISNELGNAICATNFPSGLKIIGHTLTDTEDIVVFLYDPAPVRPDHQIGIFNPTACTYSLIAKSPDLNFYNPVNALFRVRNGCDRIIYFTDNANPYRVINITDTRAWVNPTTKAITDITKISITPDHSYPAISLGNTFVVDGKGSLPYGARSYYFQHLDVDRNPINRWIPLTNYIPISFENRHGQDNEISSPYYRSPSNKAIQLSIENIDTSFPYYRLAIVKKEGIADTITGVDITLPIERKATNNYLDTGENIDYSTEIDEILIDRLKIEKVNSHIIDKDRLYLGNLSYTTRDYSLYQRLATKLLVTYKMTPNNSREGLKPNTYVLPTNFLKDDVVALGIVYHFDNGTDSPVYHIPGRKANIVPNTHTNPYVTGVTNWDTDTISNVNAVAGNKRWQVFNTASIAPGSTTSLSKGHLGYYEVSQTYPSKIACDGASYWGLDYWGTPVDSTPIRHHKIPPNFLFVAASANKSANLHYDILLELDNVELPENALAYSIVIGEGESTIVDKGYLRLLTRDVAVKQSNLEDVYLYNYTEMDGINFQTSLSGSPSPDGDYWDIGPVPYYAFISPEGVYNSKKLEGTYVSIDKIFLDPVAPRTEIGSTFHETTYDADMTITSYINNYTVYGRPLTRLNYNILDSYYLDRSIAANDSNTPADFTDQSNAVSQVLPAPNIAIQNRSKNHNINVFKLAAQLEGLSTPASPGLPYPANFNGVTILASLKTTKEVFTDLNIITYKRLCATPNFTESPVTLNGGNAYGVFFDTIENYWTPDGSPPTAFDTWADFVTGKFDYRLNIEARSTNNEGKYKYINFTGHDYRIIRKYVPTKYYELEASFPLFYPESYVLDKKYSNILSDRPYFPMDATYDFCNLCIEDTPFRIAYSQEDNTENVTDLLRQFKINNYRDIPAVTGGITDLFIAFDEAYVGTPQTLYKAFLRPQTIQASGNTTYLGTGDILSLPFKSLKSPDFALGGIQAFKDRVQTEFGLFYIDSLSGRPFLLTSNINDLALQSMRNFWEENGSFKLKTQVKELTGYSYTPYSPIHTIGYTMAYDPRFKRVIVHKKDYKIASKYVSLFQTSTTTSIITPLTLWSDGEKFYYNNSSGTPTEVFLDNSLYFEDHSFTISYSFITNSWVSFHSYSPYYMMNDYNTFYSNGIYKHNTGNFQTFYGIKYPHIVDIIAKHDPINAKVFSSIYYSSKAKLYDGNKLTYKNYPATFSGLIGYNDYQSTGYKDLTLAEAFSISNTSNAYVSKIDNLYRINDLRDLVIDKNNPIWSYSWDDVKNTPYIDKVVNISNIDPFTSEFEQARLRDYYLGLRFFFTNPMNIKLTTDLITTNYENRNR